MDIKSMMPKDITGKALQAGQKVAWAAGGKEPKLHYGEIKEIVHRAARRDWLIRIKLEKSSYPYQDINRLCGLHGPMLNRIVVVQ